MWDSQPVNPLFQYSTRDRSSKVEATVHHSTKLRGWTLQFQFEKGRVSLNSHLLIVHYVVWHGPTVERGGKVKVFRSRPANISYYDVSNLHVHGKLIPRSIFWARKKKARRISGDPGGPNLDDTRDLTSLNFQTLWQICAAGPRHQNGQPKGGNSFTF